MGILDKVFNRNKELGFIFDLDLIRDTSNRIHMKQLAIDTCISFLARTISQSEFRVKDGDYYQKDELYYRLNTRPNKNQTATTFWENFIYKLIYDNEVLVIQADDGDLLIADDFARKEYAVYEDLFYNVVVRDYEFNESFRQSNILHLKYKNKRLEPLINSLFDDYGKLFATVLSGQKRKYQIRGTVDMDMLAAKNKEHQAKLQEFIDNMYKAIGEKDVAIVPQQPGFKYKETSNSGLSGQSVEEVNKVSNGFLDQVAIAMGIPPSLIKGDVADIDKHTKNYMFFTVTPLLKKIKDEANVKFFTKEEYLSGKCIDIRKPSYRDIFDLSTAADKIRASGIMTGNEIRDELGLERADDELLDRFVITKNYQTGDEAVKGGE